MNLYKKLITIAIVIVVSQGSVITAQQSIENPQLPSEISPDTVQFAWDLHHVVFQPHFTNMGKEAIQATALLTKLGAQWWLDCANYVLGNERPAHKLLWNVASSIVKGGSTGEPYYYHANKYSASLSELVFKLSSQLQRVPGTDAILKELNEQGYTQYVASNIGTQELHYVKEHRTDMQDIFGYFNNNAHGSNGSTVSFDPETITPINHKKPHHDYFNTHKEQFGSEGKTIIFIDDQEKNVNAAKQCGIYAILFKNAQQLRTDLNNIGFNLKN